MTPIIFKNVPFVKNDWNKIGLSIYPTNVSLYFNCKKHQTVLMEHFPEFIMDGEISLCRNLNDYYTIPVSDSRLYFLIDFLKYRLIYNG